MKVTRIESGTVSLLLKMGMQAHPNEFAALLSEGEGVIREVNLIAGTTGSQDSATMYFDMVPFMLGIAGSAHSHPNGVIRPSTQDLRFFSRSGRCHIIVGYPYGEEDWGCFGTDGTPLQIEVISRQE